MTYLLGKVHVQLSLHQGAVAAVRVDNQRPNQAAKVLVGTSLEQGLTRLPLMYTLCGMAHGRCAFMAAAVLRQQAVTLELELWQSRLVQLEILREHSWRLLVDWPRLASMPDATYALSQLFKAVNLYRQQLLVPVQDPFDLNLLALARFTPQIDPAPAIIEETLEHALFGIPVEAWCALETVEDLQEWAHLSDTLAAGLVRLLFQQGWCDTGAIPSQPLAALAPEWLAQQLLSDEFMQTPAVCGEVRETGAGVRAQSPLLAAIQDSFGFGLLRRVVARLTELGRLVMSLRQAAAEPLTPEEPGYCQATRLNAGEAVAQISASRGQLIHWLKWSPDQIENYKILAPTDWNFQAKGPLTRALYRLRGTDEEIRTKTNLLINCMDPCVDVELHIDSGATQRARNVTV